MKEVRFYPKLTEEMYELADIQCSPYFFCYKYDNEEYPLIYEIDNGEYILQDSNNRWNSSEYNLKIKTRLQIFNPRVLFGEKGLVPQNTKLVIALQWFSKQSNKIDTILDFSFDISDEFVDEEIMIDIKKDRVREQLNLSLVLAVGEIGTPNKNEQFLANEQGIVLGKFNVAKIMLEGKGSEFPISITSLGLDKELWRLEYNVDDPTQDLFHMDNICILLNKDHKDYNEIDEDNIISSSPLFKEIFSTAVYMILMNLKEEGLLLETKNRDDFSEGTVCAAMHYFITTFNIDISNINDMANSIRREIDREL